MQIIEITSLTGNSPYDITICDITKTYCYVVVTGVTSAPIMVDIPTELLGTQELIVVVTDSTGCETFSNYNFESIIFLAPSRVLHSIKIMLA